MIVRKPYAFLIKHFRLIHAILFLMLLYLSIRCLSIYSFFNDYATNHYFNQVISLASDYIKPLMFIVCIISILLGAVIFYLLSIKKKKRTFYVFLCLYYIVLIIYYIYIYNTMFNLTKAVLSVESVRAIRDIALIIILPQLFFLIICVVRMLGFNLKSFEFKKDLEDLKIDTSDYEEVEVMLGQNNYKYARAFRKAIRYSKYFILENKFFVTILASILVLSISGLIYFNVKVQNEKHAENEELVINSIKYTVEDSFYTKKSSNGSIIRNGKTYLLVKIKMHNRSYNKYDLSKDLFRLNVNGELRMPILNLTSEFIDIGTVFTAQRINEGEEISNYVVFEMNDDELKEELILKIKNMDEVISSSTSKYTDVIINPKNNDVVTKSNTYKVGDEIDFSDSILENTKLTIINYTINDTLKEKSKYCLSGECYDKVYVVQPSSTDMSILKLSVNFQRDNNVSLVKTNDKLFNIFGKISYYYKNETFYAGLKSTFDMYNTDEFIYFDIPKEVKDAERISIIITIRDKIYTINLK